ncbi:hypothetical protein [Aeropyrum camini]|uniref:Membrane carboxypeptidase n=1 Tax=Aeropyrum camini SY1 = JCM 12091 TaxID=1198449 RepID=U3TET5_9CREN|nr:hypothetical protein [Aeropyrum camini]BAN89839.1 membrane carboxypeptidase [Aeropyrum camini SY1 = JCM 12091]
MGGIRVVRVRGGGVDSVPPMHPVVEGRVGRDIESVARHARSLAAIISGSRAALDGIVRVTLDWEGARVVMVARGGEVLAIALFEDGDLGVEGSYPRLRASEASEAV